MVGGNAKAEGGRERENEWRVQGGSVNGWGWVSRGPASFFSNAFSGGLFSIFVFPFDCQ